MNFLDDLVIALNRSIQRYPDALNYLKSRGVQTSDIERYSIGYNKVVNVPDDGTEDRQRFMDESYKGRSFESTLIFPIKDAFGKTVGIIGRGIEEKRYKKFFSEEAKFTGCFFGFFQALPSIYETGTVFITEGSFDCIPLAGILPNTVGALTAGLSEEQYNLISFYCDKIVTVFDWDKEGQRQTWEAIKKWGAYLPRGESPKTQARVFSCRIGKFKDPSSYLSEYSLEEFHKFVKKELGPKISSF